MDNYFSKILFIERRIIKWNKLDYSLFFLIIPFILLIIFLLPEPVRSQLILVPSNPTLLSIFFSNYTHDNLGHFVSNFVPYLMIIYYLFNLETNKKVFYVSTIFFLMIIPILVSTIDIFFLTNMKASLGFSGVVSGFMGYLVYSVYQHIKKFHLETIDYDVVVWIFLVNLWIVSVLWLNVVPIIFPIMSVVVLYFSYFQITNIKEIIRIIRLKEKGRIIDAVLYIILFIILIFSLVMLMPVSSGSGSIWVNVPAHILGYMIGIVMPIIIIRKM